MLKIISTLAVSVPINFCIELGFYSCKRPQGNLLCGRTTFKEGPHTPAQRKYKEKVGSEVRLGRVRPDDQRPSQSCLCMEAVPWLLNTPPPPEGAHQDTPERAGQAQLPRTSMRPTPGSWSTSLAG